MSTVVFPGTFDPVTIGHLDIIRRGLKIFDHITVAVGTHHEKRKMFSVNERMAMLREAVETAIDDHDARVNIVSFTGLLVDFAREQKVTTIIRGLRVLSDFEYEFQMALMNRKLADSVETVFLMPSEELVCLTSTMVKEIARLGGPIEKLVPPCVVPLLSRKLALGMD
ncbi:MAG: pantetheine-phosphate adenylyltransferase [Candidatus Eiseniibacteriota bacterium]